MGRPFKPNCDWCGAPREKGVTCACRKRASYEKHKDKYLDAYHADPEKYIARVKKYQQENAAAVNAKNKAWRAANREAYNAYMREYDERNRAKRRLAKWKWKMANPDAVRLYVHRRRTALFSAGGHLSAAQWRGICEGQGQRCFDCDELKPLTVGHIVPVSKGGSNNVENIIAQCQSCNSKQGRRIHPKFAEALGEGHAQRS